MRALLISIYYPPEIGANSRVVAALSQTLAAQGATVTVLTDFPHYPKDELDPEYRWKVFRQESLGEVRVLRTWMLIAQRSRKWLRIASHLSFALSAIIGGLRSGPQDVIYVYSPPLFLGFTAVVLARLKRVPFIFNVQDIYPDIAVEHGVIRNNALISVLSRFERWVYSEAAAVTVISEGFRQNLIAKGVRPERISVIPNWADDELFEARNPESSFARSLRQHPSQFLVTYTGNIGFSQGLETVIEAARLLRHNTNIRFVILGEGVRRQAIMALAESYALDNVCFLPFQARDRQLDVLAASDASLVILEPEKSRSTIPSKTYEIMAMGRAIIASVDKDGDAWKLIEEVGAGLWAQPGSPAALAETILELYNNPGNRPSFGNKGRHHARAHFTAKHAGQRYHELMEDIIARGRNKKDRLSRS